MNINQALADHSIRHAKILEALETEKQKIAQEVQILQQNRSHRDKTCISEYLLILADIF
jgi:kinesin family protein 14